ncbi:hypothetical protein K402DRAFT_185032 [Aulographum hederae CBS 113979]|uniref:Uncharacterized protein n=1 Tax=Aulographum hederae CBS 113979 TaxID=1176131 RepID=A0A6G1GQE5_9PEZI|nr:hypothetical protein K402DRAFT_185032 [Aulographum hederae CBS 113979]
MSAGTAICFCSIFLTRATSSLCKPPPDSIASTSSLCSISSTAMNIPTCTFINLKLIMQAACTKWIPRDVTNETPEYPRSSIGTIFPLTMSAVGPLNLILVSSFPTLWTSLMLFSLLRYTPLGRPKMLQYSSSYRLSSVEPATNSQHTIPTAYTSIARSIVSRLRSEMCPSEFPIAVYVYFVRGIFCLEPHLKWTGSTARFAIGIYSPSYYCMQLLSNNPSFASKTQASRSNKPTSSSTSSANILRPAELWMTIVLMQPSCGSSVTLYTLRLFFLFFRFRTVHCFSVTWGPSFQLSNKAYFRIPTKSNTGP